MAEPTHWNAGYGGFLFRLFSAWLAMLFFIAAHPAPAQTPPPETAASPAPDTAPVTIDGEVLFQVRGIGAYPADQRADEIAAKIEAAALDPAFQPATLRATDRGSFTEIGGGTHLILRVSDPDAALEGMPRALVAPIYAKRIERAMAEYRGGRTREAIGTGTFHAAIALAIGAALLMLVLWLLRRGEDALRRLYDRRMDQLGAESRRILRVETLWKTLRGIIRLVRVAVVLMLLLFVIEYVLTRFPWTRAAGRRMFAAIADPLRDMGHNFVAAIPNMVLIAIIFFITRYVLSLARLYFDAIERGTVSRGGFEPEWAQPTFGLIRVLIIALGVIIAYPLIPGSDSLAFKGLSILAGALVALGSSAAMANIVAGYLILYRRAFRIGDRVKIGDVTGIVTDLRLQVTHLRNHRNEEINIPNATILTSEVVNFSIAARQGKLALHTEVGIGYEVPWRQVEAMLTEAARATQGIMAEPKPFVLQTRLGDFAVVYELHAYTDQTILIPHVYADLHRNILDQFNANNVQIMTPAYEGDPEQPKVVAKDQWFAPAVPPDLQGHPE